MLCCEMLMQDVPLPADGNRLASEVWTFIISDGGGYLTQYLSNLKPSMSLCLLSGGAV